MLNPFRDKRLENILTNENPFPGQIDTRYLMGYIRGDHDGYRWWSTIFSNDRALENEERVQELDFLYRAFIRQIKGLTALAAFCKKYAEPTTDPTEYNAYCITQNGVYWFRFILRRGDYNVYLKAYVPTVLNTPPKAE